MRIIHNLRIAESEEKTEEMLLYQLFHFRAAFTVWHVKPQWLKANRRPRTQKRHHGNQLCSPDDILEVKVMWTFLLTPTARVCFLSQIHSTCNTTQRTCTKSYKQSEEEAHTQKTGFKNERHTKEVIFPYNGVNKIERFMWYETIKMRKSSQPIAMEVAKCESVWDEEREQREWANGTNRVCVSVNRSSTETFYAHV